MHVYLRKNKKQFIEQEFNDITKEIHRLYCGKSKNASALKTRQSVNQTIRQLQVTVYLKIKDFFYKDCIT